MGHLILKPTCKSCRELKAHWDKELEALGCPEIENGRHLTDHKSACDLAQRTNFQTHDTYQANVSYYQWARDKLNQGLFTSYRDRLIWENHTEGLSRRKISKVVGLEQSWVTRKLQKIENYLLTNSVASMSCQLALF